MTEQDIEISSLKEQYAATQPRIISDNVPQSIAKEFKKFVRISGTTHVRTSPFYPQSNGKLKQNHQVGVIPAQVHYFRLTMPHTHAGW